MKVAIVMPHRVDDANSGDRLRTLSLRYELVREGCDVTIVAPDWSVPRGRVREGSEGELLVGQGRSGLARLAWRGTLSIGRRADPYFLHDRAVAASIGRAIAQLRPDVVDIQHSYMSVAASTAPVVATLHNVHANPSFLPEITARQRRSALAREQSLIDSAGAVVVFSENERDRLGEADREASWVVPIGHPLKSVTPVAVRPDMHDALFVGSMDYLPNLKTALHLVTVWPAIRESTSLRRLSLVGRAAGRVAERAGEPLPVGVEVHADVADISPFYERADVTLMPVTSGGGTRLKAIEAMAYGLPIVGSALAVEGLHLVEGEAYSRVENDAELIAAVRHLEHPLARQKLQTAAIDAWRSSHSPEHMATMMREIYETVTRTA